MAPTLFELEMDYYLGNYQSCLSKAHSMPSSREVTFYMCLSYYHLKKYDLLELELNKTKEQCVLLIGLLVAHNKNPAGSQAILTNLDNMLEEKKIDTKDELSRLVVSAIYVDASQFQKAIQVLLPLETLPGLLAQSSVYVLMNRVDQAERIVKIMQNKDDYSKLTLLATAQVRLAAGNPKEALQIAMELKDLYRSTPLVDNIQAAAAISSGELGTAKTYIDSALDMDNDNLEALTNMIYYLSTTRSTNATIERYFDRLKTLYPTSKLVQEIERMNAELGL